MIPFYLWHVCVSRRGVYPVWICQALLYTLLVLYARPYPPRLVGLRFIGLRLVVLRFIGLFLYILIPQARTLIKPTAAAHVALAFFFFGFGWS